jgi:hypothetical protein
VSDPTQPTSEPVLEPPEQPADQPADQEATVDDTALIEIEAPADGTAVESDPPPTGGYRSPTTPPLAATSGTGVAERGPRSGPSVPTVLWGLILALVAALAIVHQVSDVDINLAVGVPVVLLGVGGALVAWGIAGLARKRT